jgi:hypothetical protein
MQTGGACFADIYRLSNYKLGREMNVETTHHVDASEPDANGMYEYRYEYDLFSFSDGRLTLVARSYTNEAEAHFLRIEADGQSRLLTRANLKLPLFASAVEHLRGLGKKDINWLSGRGNGYEPVLFTT